MKTKICTSIEQSKKLLELGLDADTADMHLLYFGRNNVDYKIMYGFSKEAYESSERSQLKYYPSWSLSALLELMPEIGFANKPILDLNGIEINYSGIHFTRGYDEPIDAAYEMICWLLENKYI